MGLGNSVAFNFYIFGIVTLMYVQFVSTATIGPRNRRAFKNCILKNLLKAWHGGVKFVVESLLKAPPPGANNNEEQQWEVVLMKNKYKGGGGGLNICR